MSINAWRKDIQLKAGDELVHERSEMRGFMQEEDVDTYRIQAADGSTCGTVVVSDHIAVNGFKRTIYVVQRDSNSKVIFEKRYPISKA